MNTNSAKKYLSEEKIDQIVIEQADDDEAWDPPIQVHPVKPTALSIPVELANRATFLAQLHRMANMEEWLTRIIQERVELEEAAFMTVKRQFSVANSLQAA